MLETILNDMVGVFKTIFLSGDLISLVIAVGAIGIAAFMMERGGQIGSMTLMALALFALGGFIRGVMKGPVASEGGSVATQAGSRAVGQLTSSWQQFYGMEAGTLFAYFLTFLALIFVGFGIKTALMQSGGGHH
jgi:hypothetical protein